MSINLQEQNVLDAIDNGNVIEECNDMMSLATIYQVVLEDVLLMLAKKNSIEVAWETLQTMHMGVEQVNEEKLQILKSEFEAIHMKNDESIDDFAMKLMMIVSGIHLLSDKQEEISVAKKFSRVILLRFMQIVTSIEQFGDLKNMLVQEVIVRLKVHEERLRGYDNREEEKNLLLT